MSRNYAIALIFCCLSQFAALLWLWNENLTEQRTGNDALLVAAAERIEETTKDRIREFRNIADEDRRELTQPLLTYAKRVQQELTTNPERGIQAKVDTLLANYVRVLRTHSNRFALETTEIDDIQTALTEELSPFITDYVDEHRHSAEAPVTFAKRQLLLAMIGNRLVNDALDMVSYRRIVCDFISYYPTLMTPRLHYSKGDTLKALVGVGFYRADLNRKTARVCVGGQSLELDETGLATYRHVIRGRGEQTLITTAEVMNPSTREVRTGEGSFSYIVD